MRASGPRMTFFFQSNEQMQFSNFSNFFQTSGRKQPRGLFGENVQDCRALNFPPQAEGVDVIYPSGND